MICPSDGALRKEEYQTMHTRSLAAAALITIALIAPAHAEDTIILRAPPGAPDDHDCSVSVDNKALPCDLALYLGDDKRVRIQFNNDDSGRMVIFEGKKTKTAVVTIDAVTVGAVEGQPKKVKMTKATGLCVPYVGREVRCQAQAVNGNLFTASVERTR
jgi:hypothetical protein